MGLLSWIIVGGISGWLATLIIRPKRQKGCLTSILLGIVGGFMGGFIVSLWGGIGVTGLNLYSILVATFGAIVIIWLSRKLID